MTPRRRLLLAAVCCFYAIFAIAHAAPDELLSGRAAALALAADAAAAAAAAQPSGSGGAAAAAAAIPGGIASLQAALLRDADLKYARQAQRLVYACAGMTAPAGGSSAAAPITTTPTTTASWAAASSPSSSSLGFVFPTDADPPPSSAFQLHSRPGAPWTIVLDFTGHTLRSGTAWRYVNRRGDTPINVPRWSLDSDRSSFSNTELSAIVGMWRQVAEHFSPWDIDVTTEEPPGSDDAADASLVGRGVRVAIGPNDGWMSPSGGVAFLNSIGQSWSGPVAFAFNNDPMSAPRTVTHEVGHTLGLNHAGNVAYNGTAASEYFFGYSGGPWGE